MRQGTREASRRAGGAGSASEPYRTRTCPTRISSRTPAREPRTPPPPARGLGTAPRHSPATGPVAPTEGSDRAVRSGLAPRHAAGPARFKFPVPARFKFPVPAAVPPADRTGACRRFRGTRAASCGPRRVPGPRHRRAAWQQPRSLLPCTAALTGRRGPSRHPAALGPSEPSKIRVGCGPAPRCPPPTEELPPRLRSPPELSESPMTCCEEQGTGRGARAGPGLGPSVARKLLLLGAGLLLLLPELLQRREERRVRQRLRRPHVHLRTLQPSPPPPPPPCAAAIAAAAAAASQSTTATASGRCLLPHPSIPFQPDPSPLYPHLPPSPSPTFSAPPSPHPSLSWVV